MERLRLVDLLDRIRPTGAPGALGDSAAAVDRAVADELLALRRRLLDLDEEAACVVDDARSEADRVISRARATARRRRAEIPDRVATVAGEQAARERHLTERQVTSRREQTEAAVAARRDAFGHQADELVTVAVAAIWRDVGLAEQGDGP